MISLLLSVAFLHYLPNLMFFSLFWQREGTKRDHVARFESEQITILKNCAAGLASLKQVLALPSASFFNHRICVPDSFAIATNFNYQLSIINLLHSNMGCNRSSRRSFINVLLP